MVKDKFRILDLFSGAGGFSLGFKMDNYFKISVASDNNISALKTYNINNPDTFVICGDITKKDIKSQIINESKKRNVNMIIGGPPCQGFSLKGKRLGFADSRNFLFKEFLEIVSNINPEIFIVENVKSILSTCDGFFVKEIEKFAKKNNYYISTNVLNAKYFGIPQNRERAFIICSKKKKISIQNNTKQYKKITVKDAISDLSYLESGEGSFSMDYKFNPESNYQKEMRKNSNILYNHKCTFHSDLVIKKLKMIPPESGKEYLPLKYHGKQKFKTTWSRLVWDDISPTIDTRFDTPSNGKNSHPILNRSITPREAARLQSFPDTFIFFGNKTEICKQIGNAVPPLLSKHIAKIIKSEYEK